jgi:hypothetical protein
MTQSGHPPTPSLAQEAEDCSDDRNYSEENKKSRSVGAALFNLLIVNSRF